MGDRVRGAPLHRRREGAGGRGEDGPRRLHALLGAYDAQSAEYKESVLPAACTTRVSVEAGSTMGWGKYVGASGVAIGLDRFGASAPGGKLYEEFGFTVDTVVASVKGQ